MIYIYIFLLLWTTITIQCASGGNVCDDDDGGFCNVITSVSFVNDTGPIDYTTLGPTVVGNVTYNSVIKWVSALDEVLTYSWEVYPDSVHDPFNCSTSKVWINGTVLGTTTYLRGVQNTEPYCIFNIQESVLPQSIIDNPVNNVYFLFSDLLDIDDLFYITKNVDVPVMSIESVVFYMYSVDTYTLMSNNTGSTLTLDINDRVYTSPTWSGQDTGCNNQHTIMNTLSVGSCSLTPIAHDHVNGIFTYDFPISLYDYCSNSREVSGNDYIFTIIITLPGVVGSCDYFEHGTYTSLITIDQDNVYLDDGPHENVVTLGLVGYSIEMCPQQDYILPRARSLFIVNYTYTGEAISLIDIPYLDTENDPLTTESVTCTTGTIPNMCIYEMKSSICMPLLNVQDASGDECAFDDSFSKTLHDMSITQIIDEGTFVSATTEFLVLPTALTYELFNSTYCLVGGTGSGVVNTTSELQSNVKIRNRPYPDWEDQPTSIQFYDDMIIQVELENVPVGGTQIHITSVVFRMYDPDTGGKINEFIFNKGDKERMHRMGWTRFYDDVHFCSHMYHNGTCDVFYNTDTTRVNDYTLSNIIPQLQDVCQMDQVATVNDHFSFSPSKWFKGLTIPTIGVFVDVTSLLVVCEPTGGRLLSETFKTSTTMNFVSNNAHITADTAIGNKHTTSNVLRGDLLLYRGEDTVIIVALLVVLIIVSFFAFKRNIYINENHY
jgi:hypothetical protein